MNPSIADLEHYRFGKRRTLVSPIFVTYLWLFYTQNVKHVFARLLALINFSIFHFGVTY